MHLRLLDVTSLVFMFKILSEIPVLSHFTCFSQENDHHGFSFELFPAVVKFFAGIILESMELSMRKGTGGGWIDYKNKVSTKSLIGISGYGIPGFLTLSDLNLGLFLYF